MARIFGLDIGTTSIGFAVIDHDSDQAMGTIHRLGVRIFPEARDPDGTPLNQTRRQKRMARRQLRRRRARRRQLNERLADAGLLPSYGTDAWDAVMAADPYDLRRRALVEKLPAHELGRTFYHLAKHRHFKGRDLVEDLKSPEGDADEKEASSNREQTQRAVAAARTTLGAWLAGQEKKRGHHAARTDVEAEFEEICAKQGVGDGPLKNTIHSAIFHQRPVFWRKNTLGDCRFVPGAELCAKSSWLSQQRRMLEKLNNLAVAGGNARPLEPEERAAILAKLQTQASMSWGAARKALAPLLGGEEKKLKFNLEAGGERELLGNPLEAKLSAIFGKDWEDHPRKQAIRDTVPACLWAADYGVAGTQRVVIRPASERKALRAQASQAFVADLDVTEEQAQALCDLTLPSGWEPYSIEALRAILPQLEAGVRFGTLINSREPEWENWRAATFPNREQPTGELYDRLPSPAVKDERERLKAVRNPTVVRVQNELRKVVNNLIDLFGKPDLIRVEVARDIGRSKRDREEVQAFQRRQELQRRKAEQNLTENHIVNPSNDDIEKWLLWKECGERCPYSGDAIGFADLFGELPKFEVEHIWPCSRSFDDSFANKTLCRRDLNLKKGDKTPFEAFGADDDHWGRIVKWIDGITASKGKPGMPRKKVRRFLAREMPDDFANRQLTDTSYAARQAVGSLKRLWPDLGPDAPVKVQAVTGRATAQLRRLWGLNKVLADDGEKTRADHRHHAVDALAVACIHPGMTQRLARYWQGRESGARSPEMSPPWPSLRQDAQAAVARIVVSHRVRKKVSGPLHKETVYGDTGCDVMSGKVAYRALAYRVPIAKITPAILLADDLADARTIVRDGGVRRALRDHLARFGGDAKKAFAEAPTLGPDGPAIHSVRLLTKQQADLLAPVANGFADLGNNHHVAIYCLADGSTDFEIVGLFEAARRIARREPVVCRDRGDGSTFLMSLSQGDTLEFPEGDHKGFRVVQSVWSSGVVETRAHIDATKDKDAVWRPNANSLIKMGARKISVDPIGRVRKASD